MSQHEKISSQSSSFFQDDANQLKSDLAPKNLSNSSEKNCNAKDIFKSNVLHEESENFKRFKRMDRNQADLLNTQRSNEDINKHISEDYIAQYRKADDEIDKLEKFENISKLSKVSKITGTSLLKELEDKWELIEKEKNSKSKNGSKKKLNEILNYNSAKFNRFNFVENSKTSPNTNSYFSNETLEVSIKNIFAKYYNLIFKNRKKNLRADSNENNNRDNFERFVNLKLQEIKKMKNFEVPTNSEKNSDGLKNFKNNLNLLFADDIRCISEMKLLNNSKEEKSSIVYNCNTGLRMRMERVEKEKTFINNENTSNNYYNLQQLENQSIDNLVYQSGDEITQVYKNIQIKTNSSTPSKNLLSKMQDIYEIILDKPDMKKHDNSLKNIESNNYESMKLDRSQSNLNYLEKNFETILGRNGNYSKEKKPFSSANSIILEERLSTDIRETDIKNTFYFNKKNSDSYNNKIKNKIGENTKTLRDFISSSKSKNPSQGYNDSFLKCKSSSYLKSEIKSKNIYGKNEFATILNKMNSSKIQKLFKIKGLEDGN
jgi:hypothetical protein